MFVRHVKDVEKQKRADTNTSDESESECWESGESVWESGRADSQLEEEEGGCFVDKLTSTTSAHPSSPPQSHQSSLCPAPRLRWSLGSHTNKKQSEP